MNLRKEIKLSNVTKENHITTKYSCTCGDHIYRRKVCKHMLKIIKHEEELALEIKEFNTFVEDKGCYEPGMEYCECKTFAESGTCAHTNWIKQEMLTKASYFVASKNLEENG